MAIYKNKVYHVFLYDQFFNKQKLCKVDATTKKEAEQKARDRYGFSKKAAIEAKSERTLNAEIEENERANNAMSY